MSKKIGVGIIGVTPGRSWAALGHIPALQGLPEYEIRALSTTKMETARTAAEQFGVPLYFDNAEALAHAAEVDLVAVTVKVPHHLELVRTALNAGKHVYCEWPLGNGLGEAEEMADLAHRKGVHVAVGLQARCAPLMLYVRDLIATGHIGQVLSTTLIGSGMSWGAVIDVPNAYTADKKNGATLLTIPFGHTVDAVCQALGEFTELESILANRRASFLLVPDNVTHPMTSEDQVLVQGVLQGGATASIHYRGGVARGTNLLWEINGTDGDLQVTSIGGHAQMFPLALAGATGAAQALAPMEIPAKYRWTPELPAFAQNVGQIYALLAKDIATGSHTAPGFDIAVARHRMLAAVERAASTGMRQTCDVA
ncbi:MAG TPA: Gfo/Idh/MocA family oxidoreductase [Acetobacteraceae bacterium]|nr:Gfo/Idh/MocA family oxidoreductase [Acetobacteraceae bacterium]